MRFTIICDESGTTNKHLIIGALIIPRNNYSLLIEELKKLEEEGSNVLIFLDDKKNRYPFRLPVLKKTLNATLKRDLYGRLM